MQGIETRCRMRSTALMGSVRRHASAIMSAAALLCAGAGRGLPAQAWAESDAVKELAAPPPIELPLKPSPEFAKFPRYAGMLGSRQIVLRLGAKTDDPVRRARRVSVHRYREVILIAGDRDGDTLEVEESNDGTHITGNWVGKFAADGSVSGERMNVDDSDPQPFDLKPLAAGQAVPAAAVSATTAGKAPPRPGTGRRLRRRQAASRLAASAICASASNRHAAR